MHFNLPKSEILAYVIYYSVFLFAGLHNIYSVRDKILDGTQKYGFKEGWSFIGRPKDNWNYEWESSKAFLWKNLHFYALQIILTEVFRIYAPKRVAQCHLFVGLAYLLASYNPKIIVIIVLQMLTFYFAAKITNSVVSVWIIAGLWEIIVNSFKTISLNFQYDQFYEMIMILCWNVLKSLSFTIDRINCKTREERKAYSFMRFCSYYLYFPVLVHGPIMIYDRYKTFIENDSNALLTLKERSTKLFFSLLKVIVWIFLLDFAMHFFYISCLERNPEIVKHLNIWGVYGFGYLMGIYFTIQYTVHYGTAISIAKFENINAPNPPKCVARIHFYSDMWKYFDQGLYEFLFKYIYAKLCSKSSSFLRKLVASFATFAYIFVWHGLYGFIFIWAILNFTCITLEKLFKMLINTEFYKNLTGRYLSERNQSRLYGLCIGQIFIPSAISNFYFFAGIENGNYFVKKTYENCFMYITLSIFTYTFVQCAELVWDWERSKAEKLKIHSKDTGNKELDSRKNK